MSDTKKSMSSQSILTIRDLSKHFGGVKALDGINIEVNSGELLGIIGPNGAGKTALINTITGFYRATTGSIELDATEISQLPMHQIGRLGISRTFQNIRLFKRMSVLENVLVAFKSYTNKPIRSFFHFGGASRADIEQAMDLLKLMQLADRPNVLASSLSYGDARRLEIARALAGKPKLLLLDEPAAGMNETETRQLTRDIQSIRNQVPAIMLVEHDMTLIRSLSDRIVAMDYGKKIAEGSAEEVLNHPEVLRAYLGVDSEEAKV